MRRFLFGSRRRKVFAALGAIALTTGTAMAAWVVYTGWVGSGPNQGTFGSATTQTAITMAPVTIPQITGPGDSQGNTASFTNQDATDAHSITSATGVFTSTPSQCASHLSFSFPGDTFPIAFTAGQTRTLTVAVSAGPSIPVACAEGSYSFTVSGTTSP